MSDTKIANDGAAPRAVGDVVTNSASKSTDSGLRAGGDVVTKGASQQPMDSGKRAGGDVVTKGASKTV